MANPKANSELNEDHDLLIRLNERQMSQTVQLDDLQKNVSYILDRLDTRYASKWVEKFVIGLITFILTAFLTVLVSKVIPYAII